MSHDLNLCFIHLPQCALFRRIKGPNSGFVPSRPQTRKTDANRSQCRRMPPKSPKKCSVMMCDVGCHIQCGFSKNSEGATIFGTPAESASEQWVAHTHTQDSSKTSPVELGWHEPCSPHYYLSKRSKNHGELFVVFPKSSNNTKQTRYEIKHFFFPGGAQKACSDAKKYNMCREPKGKQKPGLSGFPAWNKQHSYLYVEQQRTAFQAGRNST